MAFYKICPSCGTKNSSNAVECSNVDCKCDIFFEESVEIEYDNTNISQKQTSTNGNFDDFFGVKKNSELKDANGSIVQNADNNNKKLSIDDYIGSSDSVENEEKLVPNPNDDIELKASGEEVNNSEKNTNLNSENTSKLPLRFKFCSCGEQNPEYANHCSRCGDDISSNIIETQENYDNRINIIKNCVNDLTIKNKLKKEPLKYIEFSDPTFKFTPTTKVSVIGRGLPSDGGIKAYLASKARVSRSHLEIWI